jgi:iron-sulfur cluster assembly accessory protein
MVEGGGCSGYQYIFKMDSILNEQEDISIGNDGNMVVIDKLSLPFLEGSVIDFKASLIRASFTVIDNPKADVSCSCGSSFAPKMGNNKI